MCSRGELSRVASVTTVVSVKSVAPRHGCRVLQVCCATLRLSRPSSLLRRATAVASVESVALRQHSLYYGLAIDNTYLEREEITK